VFSCPRYSCKNDCFEGEDGEIEFEIGVGHEKKWAFEHCCEILLRENAHRIGKDIPSSYYSISYLYNKRLTPLEQFQSQFVDNKRKKWKDKEKYKDGNYRFVILNNLVQFEILEFKKIDEDFFKGKTPYKVRKVPGMDTIKDSK